MKDDQFLVRKDSSPVADDEQDELVTIVKKPKVQNMKPLQQIEKEK